MIESIKYIVSIVNWTGLLWFLLPIVFGVILFYPNIYAVLFYKRWGVVSYGGGDDPGKIVKSFDTYDEANDYKKALERSGKYWAWSFEVERCP